MGKALNPAAVIAQAKKNLTDSNPVKPWHPIVKHGAEAPKARTPEQNETQKLMEVNQRAGAIGS
jgi:hypothetical protein